MKNLESAKTSEASHVVNTFGHFVALLNLVRYGDQARMTF